MRKGNNLSFAYNKLFKYFYWRHTKTYIYIFLITLYDLNQNFFSTAMRNISKLTFTAMKRGLVNIFIS